MLDVRDPEIQNPFGIFAGFLNIFTNPISRFSRVLGFSRTITVRIRITKMQDRPLFS